ncbi:MAG: beta-galactosidase [bacterium]
MSTDVPTICVDYYPEHWPQARWQRDFELMQGAGVTAIRMAEFAWCRIEPNDGTYTFEWLDEAIAAAAAHGIRTILCTPTATPPAWLCEAHPEIVSVLADGRAMAFGGRRHYDPSSSVYRDYSARITRTMAEHYSDEPSVFAWQIDNELYGNTPCFSDSMRAAFRDWLREEYGAIEELNRAWGTVFWSQEYSSFDQVPLPDGDPALAGGELAHHPSLQLAFRRFRSKIWIDYCAAQARILRSVNPQWIITTNAYLFRWGDAIEYPRMFEGLDVYSFDNYAESADEGAFYNDLAASITPRYWTLEQRAAAPAGQYLWPPDSPGMSSMAIQTLDHGASLVSFFRWRQVRFGREQNHGAILPHDGRPREHYAVLQETVAHARSLARLAPGDEGREPQVDPKRFIPPAPILVHYAWEDSWVRQIARSNDYLAYVQDHVHAGLRHGASVNGDEGAAAVRFAFPGRIRQTMDALAGGSAAAGGEAPEAVRLFVVPMAIVSYPQLAAFARRLAEAGATVICTTDLARKDIHNVFSEEPLPAEWGDLLGVTLERQCTIRSEAERVATTAGYECLARIDEISVHDATVLDTFAGGPYPGAPALTERAYGAGRFRYAAGLFDRAFWRTQAAEHVEAAAPGKE